MTADEFDRWWKSYAVAFPDTGRWMGSLPDPGGTLAAWAQVLTRTTFADAMAAIDRLLDGRAEPLKAFERENAAHHVRAIASRAKLERDKAERERRQSEAASEWEQRDRIKHIPLGESYRVIRGAYAAGKERGMSGLTLKLFADAEFERWYLAECRARGLEAA